MVLLLSAESKTLIPFLDKINNSFRIVLGSASPRRSELLGQMGLFPDVIKSTFDENLDKNGYPDTRSYCLDTAYFKGLDVCKQMSLEEDVFATKKDTIVLCADTIVDLGGKIYEKPRDFNEAYAMLSSLSGQVHDVHTSVVFFDNFSPGDKVAGSFSKSISFVETTSVEFLSLSEEDIVSYININQPYDKSGSYGIQGMGSLIVKEIRGCYYNVMGLPISRVSACIADLIQNR
jgi:septum formation protein